MASTTYDEKIRGSRSAYEHVVENMNTVSDLKKELRQATRDVLGGKDDYMSAPDQCQWMEMMVKLAGCRRGIEVGVFTGYSALCFAEALPEDGQLICCEISDEYINVGRPFFERAGVADRIDIRIGPASETLDQLIADEANHGAFDFAYLDADKTGYPGYCEQLLTLLKSNGFIIMDNTLLSDKVCDPEIRAQNANAEALHRVVQNMIADERVEVCSILFADGITMVRKK